MAETSDYDPGPWRGHDFKTARARYDAHVDRSYADAKKSKVDPTALVPKSITTKSQSPLVIVCDVTGSMTDWPSVIFSKLPYLDIEGKSYLGDDMEISFAAVGDIFSDQYPLQVQPFGKGKELEEYLKKFVVEGGGGGQTCESYDIAALYYARNCEMPNAVRPIIILIGDEGLYDNVDKEGAKNWANVDLSERMTVHYVIRELQRKFSVYAIRKMYDHGTIDGMSDLDKRLHQQWEKLLGEDHVVVLPKADRVVDVIFGILAKETGKDEYFEDEITARQRPDQVETVMKSLNSIHRLGAKSLKKLPPADKGKSVTHKTVKKGDKSKDSISLL